MPSAHLATISAWFETATAALMCVAVATLPESARQAWEISAAPLGILFKRLAISARHHTQITKGNTNNLMANHS